MGKEQIIGQIARLLDVSEAELMGLEPAEEQALQRLLEALSAREVVEFSAEDASKVLDLIQHENADFQEQALAILHQSESVGLWAAITNGCSIDAKGVFQSSILKVTHGVFRAFCENPNLDHDGVEHLDLTGCSWIRWEDVHCLSHLGLRKLTMNKFGNLSNVEVCGLDSISGLTELEILETGLASPVIEGLTRLQKINALASDRWATFTDFSDVDFSQCPDITELSINLPSVGGKVSLPKLRPLSKLEHLRFEMRPLKGVSNSVICIPEEACDFTVLGQLKSLKRLTINAVVSPFGPSTTLDGLVHLPHLECVEIQPFQKEYGEAHLRKWRLGSRQQVVEYQQNLADHIALRDGDPDGLKRLSGVVSLEYTPKNRFVTTLTHTDGFAVLSRLETLNFTGHPLLRNLDGLAGLKQLRELILEKTKTEVSPQTAKVNEVTLMGYLGSVEVGWRRNLDNRQLVSDFQKKIKLYMALRDVDTEHLNECNEHLFNLGALEMSDSALAHCKGFAHLPDLEGLNLSSCKELTSLEGLPEKITWLDIDQCSSIQSFKGLEKLSGLTYFRATGLSALTDLRGCPRNENIRTFSPTDGKWSRTYLNWKSLETLDGIESFPNLESLNLQNSTKLADISALKHCTNLKVLSLSCDSLADVEVLATLPNLEELKLVAFANKKTPFDVLSVPPIFKGKPTSTIKLDAAGVKAYQKKIKLYCALRDQDAEALQLYAHETSVDISGCDLETLKGLEMFSELQSLRLCACKDLKDLQAIVGLEHLSSIYSRRSNLRPKPSAVHLSSRSSVESYQRKIQKAASSKKRK